MKHVFNLKTLLWICLVIGIGQSSYAQRYKYAIPGLDTVQQNFVIGGTSTTLLTNNQIEVLFNNQLTSFWLAVHANGENSPILDRFRRTQFNSDLIAFYGVSGSGRFDLGLQMRYSRSRIDRNASSSMFKVFESNDQANNGVDPTFDPTDVFDNSFGGLSFLGLRARFKPLVDHPELLINGGYLISTVKDEVEQTQLGADRNIGEIGITYYKDLTSNVYYFVSGNFQAFFPGQEDGVNDTWSYASTASFFLIHRTLNNKFTFYPGFSLGMNFKPSQFDEANLIRTSDFLFLLGGIQYAPVNHINFFLTGGFPLQIDLKHPQQEIERRSYSTLAIGFRGKF